MSGIRNGLQAGHDVPEDIHVPDPERARNVRLALQSLDPFSTPQDHQESFTPCTDLSSSTSKKILRHKKKYRPPALTLDVQLPVQQLTESFLDFTEPESRQLKSQRSLPTLRTVPLPVPTHPYRSSITFNFPNSSPTSTVASSPTATVISTATFLTVPSAHPPLSPSTPPPPPSPSTTKRKRFSRLCRKFGESPPPELVFGGLPLPVGMALEPKKAKARVQNASCFTPIMEESAAFFAPIMEEKEVTLCDLDTSSTSTLGTSGSSSEDLNRSSLLPKDGEKLRHVPKQYGTACMLERKGRRITQRNYEDVLRRLRML
ncbi:hypothetical protein EDB19DRAFT_1095873 [Suillus lakei]|nr:hypothetical protein EDB19DRAFT_1095873 [Suillus lakei]